ncbi:MAG: GNAT family N-acetyltransferase [Nitriliruptorales bacterium]
MTDLEQPEIALRRAIAKDANAIAEVYVASAQHHVTLAPDAYRVPEIEDVTAHYERILAEEGWAVFVAQTETDGIIGSVEARVAPPPAPHSMLRHRRVAHVGIAVLPDHRGSGVGRELMLATEAWAAEHDVEAILLDMLSANAAARRFYERLGYREFGTLLLKTVTNDVPWRRPFSVRSGQG